MSNGTTALVAALRAHRIGPGAEVITTPLTFVATLNAILEVGAVARFADIGDDLTIDPAGLAALVTPRTRALMPVHLFGLPAAMVAISELAHQRGLAIIEDAAQAHGAQVGAAHVGSFGTAAFSFHGTKNITCGEGGIVTTNDDSIALRLRLLRNHGMREPYQYVLPGYNYRLTDLQAVIATAQLRRLPEINDRRARNAARLSEGLGGLAGLVVPATAPGRLHVWHQYVVRVTADARMDRDQLGKCLDAAGIDSRPCYPALVHDYPCYRGHPQVIADPTPGPAGRSGKSWRCPCTRRSPMTTSTGSCPASGRPSGSASSRVCSRPPGAAARQVRRDRARLARWPVWTCLA